jgi:hypothetical protein
MTQPNAAFVFFQNETSCSLLPGRRLKPTLLKRTGGAGAKHLDRRAMVTWGTGRIAVRLKGLSHPDLTSIGRDLSYVACSRGVKLVCCVARS